MSSRASLASFGDGKTEESHPDGFARKLFDVGKQGN